MHSVATITASRVSAGLAGDFDDNGKVDLFDFFLFADAFGGLSVNQYAVDNIRSLVKGGLTTMARSGLKATGSVYGYERNEDKALGVVKSEAVVVSKIFKLYSQHRSLGKVAHTLNRQQILTRRGRSFSRMTIKNILNNKTYAGRIVHNGMETKGIHKPIVSTRLWNRCNQMLSRVV